MIVHSVIVPGFNRFLGVIAWWRAKRQIRAFFRREDVRAVTRSYRVTNLTPPTIENVSADGGYTVPPELEASLDRFLSHSHSEGFFMLSKSFPCVGETIHPDAQKLAPDSPSVRHATIKISEPLLQQMLFLPPKSRITGFSVDAIAEVITVSVEGEDLPCDGEMVGKVHTNYDAANEKSYPINIVWTPAEALWTALGRSPRDGR